MMRWHPKPGGGIAAAGDYGIDLSLLAASLRRSPDERRTDLQRAMEWFESMPGAAWKRAQRRTSFDCLGELFGFSHCRRESPPRKRRE